MTTLPQTLHSRALELRQKHQNVELALLESVLNEGAQIAIEKLTVKIKQTREGFEQGRLKGNRPQ